MHPSRVLTRLRALTVAAVMVAASPAATTAHDIPATTLVRVFVKPEGTTLRVLVRVRLETLRDINWPTRGPAYLDIAAALPLLNDAARQWIVDYLEMYEDGSRLAPPGISALRLSLPSDLSFATWDSALAHLRGPTLPAATEIPWQQTLLDVLLEYRITSDRARFSIRPGLAHLGVRTTTVLRFLPAGGTERAYEYLGDPGLVRLDPRWHQAAWRFVRLGFGHILDGIDHLLFVLCLVIPFRQIRPLVLIVTSFTVAHSITLIASASGLAPGALWFPPLIETLIAMSIVYMALENIVGTRPERRWLVAFGFGMVHGFAFSFTLRESFQFAGTHLLTSLVSFNAGVELGQIFVLLLAIPLLNLLFRRAVPERMGVMVLSVLVGHTAWHWMTDRWGTLREYPLRWPELDASLLGSVMRGMMLLLIAVGAAWALKGAFGRWSPGLKPGFGQERGPEGRVL